MSEQDKPKEAATDADAKEKPEELSEEQLEAVAGGVLIGLNIATLKGDSTFKVTPGVADVGFKDIGTEQFKFLKP